MMVSPNSRWMQLKDAALKNLKHLLALRAPTRSLAAFKDLFLRGSPLNQALLQFSDITFHNIENKYFENQKCVCHFDIFFSHSITKTQTIKNYNSKCNQLHYGKNFLISHNLFFMTLSIRYSLPPLSLANPQKKKGEGRRMGGSSQANEALHLKKTVVTEVTNHFSPQTTRRRNLPSAAVGLIKICSAVSSLFYISLCFYRISVMSMLCLSGVGFFSKTFTVTFIPKVSNFLSKPIITSQSQICH